MWPISSVKSSGFYLCVCSMHSGLDILKIYLSFCNCLFDIRQINRKKLNSGLLEEEISHLGPFKS